MRIKTLTLLSKNYQKQIAFYNDVLGFELFHFSDAKASFKIGNSILTFIKDDDFTPYHYAFNIPANKENEALYWLKDRCTLLTYEGKEMQDFKSWNAKAMYFYDPDSNIVEFIARKNLGNESLKPFDAASVLEISEIGVPLNDIEKIYHILNENTKFQIYDGSFERFCPIGDEHGLFICVNKAVKDWFPTGEKAYASDFEIVFEQNEEEFAGDFKNGILQLLNI